jgi:hypothetical protein
MINSHSQRIVIIQIIVKKAIVLMKMWKLKKNKEVKIDGME